MSPMFTELPIDLTRRYRYSIKTRLRFGNWSVSYELIGAKGALCLNITGPHNYDGEDHWSAGLEKHSRTATGDEPPSHDHCHVLKGPCWHDGTSLYAERRYLPMALAGDHGSILRQMIDDADDYFKDSDGSA